MKPRIYVASSWKNPVQPFIVSMLQNQGYPVYDFRHPAQGDEGFHWSEIDPAWQDWTPAQYRKALQHPLANVGFAQDKRALQMADVTILVLPCGRSAHLELGYAVGLGQRTAILMGEEAEPEVGPIIQIPLTRGFEAIVNERDGELAKHKWYAFPTSKTVYAARSVGPLGHQRTVFMHRVIMQAPPAMEVDHINGNGLHNWRANLRIATRAQNGSNNHVIKGRVPFRGVFEKQPGKFQAGIKHLGKQTYLGTFTTPEDAARAYDAAAVQLHGTFASVNFPKPLPKCLPELMYLLCDQICLTVEELIAWLEKGE